MIYGQGKMETNESGVNRESNEGRGRFDLLPYEAIEALSKWYEEGAKKYGDRNWEKGISVKDCINRMIRHALKAGNGWTDEDHLSAVMWNAAAAITMMQRMPELNDHKWDVDPINTGITPDKVVGSLDCSTIKAESLNLDECVIVKTEKGTTLGYITPGGIGPAYINCTNVADLVTADKVEEDDSNQGIAVSYIERIINGGPYKNGSEDWRKWVADRMKDCSLNLEDINFKNIKNVGYNLEDLNFIGMRKDGINFAEYSTNERRV